MTYGNACHAERRGTRIDYAGVCEEQGENCPDTISPVCGMDNITYENACQMENAGVKKKYAGKCIGS